MDPTVGCRFSVCVDNLDVFFSVSSSSSLFCFSRCAIAAAFGFSFEVISVSKSFHSTFGFQFRRLFTVHSAHHVTSSTDRILTWLSGNRFAKVAFAVIHTPHVPPICNDE